MQSKARSPAPGDGLRFLVVPELRCGERTGSSSRSFCGRQATRARFVPALEVPFLFCADHAQPGDVPIPDDVVFRRVVLTVELFFAGVSAVESIAHSEALERLERAVRTAGGVINLHACRSLIGRATTSAESGAAPATPGDPR